MLKVILGLVVLALACVIFFVGHEMPDRFGREFEFPEEKLPPTQKTGAEIQELKVGARVYQRHVTNRPIATILEVEKAHEFPSGEIDPGVLIEFKGGTQVWVRRKHLDKMLIETPRP